MSKTNALRLLEQQKITYDTIEYVYDEEDLSLEKIAEDNNLALETIFKTLVTQGSSGEIFIAVVAGNHSLSNKKMAALVGEKKIDLAPVKSLQALTGYVRGGCSPVGMKKNFRVLLDEAGKDLNWLYVNAGKRGLLFGCRPEDLAVACAAEWADIAA